MACISKFLTERRALETLAAFIIFPFRKSSPGKAIYVRLSVIIIIIIASHRFVYTRGWWKKTHSSKHCRANCWNYTWCISFIAQPVSCTHFHSPTPSYLVLKYWKTCDQAERRIKTKSRLWIFGQKNSVFFLRYNAKQQWNTLNVEKEYTCTKQESFFVRLALSDRSI